MKYAILRVCSGPEGLGGARIEEIDFMPFETQEAVKDFFRKNPQLVSLCKVIEYQELEIRIETRVEFKKPGVTRSS